MSTEQASISAAYEENLVINPGDVFIIATTQTGSKDKTDPMQALFSLDVVSSRDTKSLAARSRVASLLLNEAKSMAKEVKAIIDSRTELATIRDVSGLWSDQILNTLKAYTKEQPDSDLHSIYMVSTTGWNEVVKHLVEIEEKNESLPVNRTIQIEWSDETIPLSMTHITEDKNDGSLEFDLDEGDGWCNWDWRPNTVVSAVLSPWNSQLVQELMED